MKLTSLFFTMALATTLTSCAQTISFTKLEQQKIAVETPGLFERSEAYTVDFAIYGEKDYSFPLPVGKM